MTNLIEDVNDRMWLPGFQSQLSRAQATLIIGPACVSPIKALFSVSEIVAGIALGVFCSLTALFLLPLAPELSFYTIAVYGLISVISVLDGSKGLLLSAVNMVTLGLFGYLTVGRGEAKSSEQIDITDDSQDYMVIKDDSDDISTDLTTEIPENEES